MKSYPVTARPHLDLCLQDPEMQERLDHIIVPWVGIQTQQERLDQIVVSRVGIQTLKKRLDQIIVP
jgi:hypothetical protein